MAPHTESRRRVKPVKTAVLRVAIVGAESTGKTTLAAALATRLAEHTGLRVTWVPEWLREWCDHVGRTPQAHEQAAVLRGQHERIEAACVRHDIVVCDTTALMTAVYSQKIFADRSLQARALHLHSRMDMTLLMALDLPWVADGVQRDGPQVQAPVDDALRELLTIQRRPWAVVSGSGSARLDHAMAALGPLLREFAQPGAPAPSGLFSRLHERDTASMRERWQCNCCDVAECERQLRAQ